MLIFINLLFYLGKESAILVCTDSIQTFGGGLFMSDENTPKVAVKAPEKEPLTLSALDHKLVDRDIKYRGPLSYRYLRLIGWMAMALTLIATVMNFAVGLQSLFPEQAEKFAKLSTASGILSLFSSLPLPLFLIANFTIILQSRNNYKKLLLTYLKIILIIYVGFIVVYYHYIVVDLMRALSSTSSSTFLPAASSCSSLITSPKNTSKERRSPSSV